MPIFLPSILPANSNRAHQDTPRQSRIIPVVPRIADIVYDLVAGGGVVTIPPIYRPGNMGVLDRDGYLTSPWHANQQGQAVGDANFGLYGLIQYQALGGGSPFLVTNEADTTPTNSYYDFTTATGAQAGWYLQGKEPSQDHPGLNLVISDGLPLLVHGNAKPGQDVYLVDHDQVTVDVLDVVNAYKVGRLIKLFSTDFRDPTTTDPIMWWVDISGQAMPSTPIA